MKRRKRKQRTDDNGFAEWGGYMEAKKTKLQNQFKIDAAKEPRKDNTEIFNGVSIFVNGYSVPSADELKLLMMKHGGTYHHYQSSKTTHIIATNLPDTKVKQLKNMNFVKPNWIVDSISAGRLLDYRDYLLYSHQSKTQPKLNFKSYTEQNNKPSASTDLTSHENKPSTSTDLTVYEKKPSTSHNFTDHENKPSSSTDFTELPQKSSDQTLISSDSGNLDFSEKLCEENKTDSSISSFCDDNSCKLGKVERPNKNVCVSNTTEPKNSGLSIKTASEAGFLSEFYSNSRLHHISTMGAMFKQYVNSLREKSVNVFPGLEKLKLISLEDPMILPKISGKFESVIMHIDMDCFFVSVGIRKRPDLRGYPVAVTHAKAGGESRGGHRTGVNRKAEFDLYKARREQKFKEKKQSHVQSEDVKPWSDWVDAIEESNSMSEIASCNYEARKVGLRNGMFLGQALKLCPNLKTIPYDFEGYKEVSYCLYDTVASYTMDIEAVSCDEMFVDCTSILNGSSTTPIQLASVLRAEITEKTVCPCSAGFGSNRLQARLATKKAKPDGQFYLEPAAVQTFMQDISVADLPGVGRSTSYKLASMGVKTCFDLQQIPLPKLQSEFGMKNGESLYKHCRGEDDKKLVFGQLRKSVSAEVNYGIRFQNAQEAESFLQELSKEVHTRLQEVNMRAKLITLKLMVKAKDAPVESAKFLGHGVCDQVSRSFSLPAPVSDLHSISREVLSLSRQLNIEPTELRGIGIQLSRLESVKATKTCGSVMEKFLCPKTEIMKMKKNTTEAENKEKKDKHASLGMDNYFAVKKNISNKKKEITFSSKPPKLVDIDVDVLEALPEDIRQEVMLEYGLGQPKGDGGGQSTFGVERASEPNKPVLYGGINYSQIDLLVLDELPLEIKNEIESTIKRNRQQEQKPPDENSENIKKQTPESSVGSSGAAEGPKLDRNLPLSEVRNLIRAWTNSEDCPQQCDIDMLTEYLQGLVTARRLDSLLLCVTCLHRCIERRGSVLWQEAYHAIASFVQRQMAAVYGLRLWIPNTFHVKSA